MHVNFLPKKCTKLASDQWEIFRMQASSFCKIYVLIGSELKYIIMDESNITFMSGMRIDSKIKSV